MGKFLSNKHVDNGPTYIECDSCQQVVQFLLNDDGDLVQVFRWGTKGWISPTIVAAEDLRTALQNLPETQLQLVPSLNRRRRVMVIEVIEGRPDTVLMGLYGKGLLGRVRHFWEVYFPVENVEKLSKALREPTPFKEFED